MPTLDEALNKISRDEIVETAKRLIRVPSVTGEERSVILLARDIMEGLGVETRLHGPEERPERLAGEVCRAILRLYSVRQAELSNFVTHPDPEPS